MRIAVDAMGGDFAPEAIVHGGIEAARMSKERYEIVFVGDRERIEKELARHFRISDLNISIYHASQKIEMGESPTSALMRKKDSSIAIAIDLHKKGQVDAVVSAGNTGAVTTSALWGLGRIRGVKRPAIGSFIPCEGGVCLLIDVGANVDCKPINLLQFGIMGSVFMSRVCNLERPRVGLLSIGEEKNKGNKLIRDSYKLLKESNTNFIGNVEGRDILKGTVDVAVCDGFVGNILLKFGESFNGMFSYNLKRKIGKKIFSNIGAFLLKPTFERLRQIFDWEEYGGVPLLGIKGVCIICHGKSSPKAIKNAIRVAEKIIIERVNEYITKELELISGVKVAT